MDLHAQLLAPTGKGEEWQPRLLIPSYGSPHWWLHSLGEHKSARLIYNCNKQEYNIFAEDAHSLMKQTNQLIIISKDKVLILAEHGELRFDFFSLHPTDEEWTMCELQGIEKCRIERAKKKYRKTIIDIQRGIGLGNIRPKDLFSMGGRYGLN